MLSLQTSDIGPHHKDRRELLRLGGLSLLGLSLPELMRARKSESNIPSADKTFGDAKNIIYLWLADGPSQHETFDPKPRNDNVQV